MHGFGVKSLITSAVLALAMTVTAAQAGSPQPTRSAVMKGQLGHMKALGAVAKGKAKADAGTVVHAMALNELSNTIHFLFPKGSGGGKSRAKDEVWTQWEKFKDAAHAFNAATPALVAAAKTGEPGKIGAALGAVGKACGACHKAFRSPKKK